MGRSIYSLTNFAAGKTNHDNRELASQPRNYTPQGHHSFPTALNSVVQTGSEIRKHNLRVNQSLSSLGMRHCAYRIYAVSLHILRAHKICTCAYMLSRICTYMQHYCIFYAGVHICPTRICVNMLIAVSFQDLQICVSLKNLLPESIIWIDIVHNNEL